MYEKSKFALITHRLLLILHLIGGVQSVCHRSSDCTGSTILAIDQADCCVGTNDGLAYSDDGGSCTVCIGESNSIITSL